MKKAEDLAGVTAGEPARVADDESNQVDHVVHGTDDAAVGSLRQPHIAGFDGAESISGKSIPVESSDNLGEHEPAGWPQIAHSDVEGERRVQGRSVNQDHAFSSLSQKLVPYQSSLLALISAMDFVLISSRRRDVQRTIMSDIFAREETYGGLEISGGPRGRSTVSCARMTSSTSVTGTSTHSPGLDVPSSRARHGRSRSRLGRKKMSISPSG